CQIARSPAVGKTRVAAVGGALRAAGADDGTFESNPPESDLSRSLRCVCCSAPNVQKAHGAGPDLHGWPFLLDEPACSITFSLGQQSKQTVAADVRVLESLGSMLLRALRPRCAWSCPQNLFTSSRALEDGSGRPAALPILSSVWLMPHGPCTAPHTKKDVRLAATAFAKQGTRCEAFEQTPGTAHQTKTKQNAPCAGQRGVAWLGAAVCFSSAGRQWG
ncbi:MAG: hypothetical protein Q4A98_11305, partial [Comamonadaceae bacterium]|nr:hypothetical protein [Comamonadaceae bacterium]